MPRHAAHTCYALPGVIDPHAFKDGPVTWTEFIIPHCLNDGRWKVWPRVVWFWYTRARRKLGAVDLDSLSLDLVRQTNIIQTELGLRLASQRRGRTQRRSGSAWPGALPWQALSVVLILLYRRTG